MPKGIYLSILRLPSPWARFISNCTVDKGGSHLAAQRYINLPTGGVIKGTHGMMGLEHLTDVLIGQNPAFERRFPGIAEKLFSPKFVRYLGFVVTDRKVDIDGREEYGVSFP